MGKEREEREERIKSGWSSAKGETEGKPDGLAKEPSAASDYIRKAQEEAGLDPAGFPSAGRDPMAPETAALGYTYISGDPRIPPGGGHTEEEYFALPDDLRVELIDGVFYAMASPRRLHQRVAFEIARQLADCIEEHGLPCFLYIAPSDVALGDDKKTIVQPDVYVHCDIEKDKGSGPLRGSPDFVLEVLSPSNPENDLWRKRELYKRHGVREYWIINPEGCRVYVFVFENSGKEDGPPEEYTFEDEVPVRISRGSCSVDFRRIHAKIRHMLEQEP